jgi:hypothetical protein
MPAKVSSICYVHNVTERLTEEYTIKEIVGVVRLDDDDPTKINYLRVKAFIPSDPQIECKIEDFESRQVILLKGKFVDCDGWYTVCLYFLFHYYSLCELFFS